MIWNTACLLIWLFIWFVHSKWNDISLFFDETVIIHMFCLLDMKWHFFVLGFYQHVISLECYIRSASISSDLMLNSLAINHPHAEAGIFKEIVWISKLLMPWIIMAQEGRAYPFWWWNQNIPHKVSQYHVCWFPGSLRRQVISNHAIDYTR